MKKPTYKKPKATTKPKSYSKKPKPKKATFDPPLDGIFCIATAGAPVPMIISGVSYTIPVTALTATTHFDVGAISSITGVADFTYVGLRENVHTTITDVVESS